MHAQTWASYSALYRFGRLSCMAYQYTIWLVLSRHGLCGQYTVYTDLRHLV